MNATRNRLLVVDDEAGIRELICYIAEENDFVVAAAPDAEACFTAIGEFAPTVIVLDLVLPGMDGIEILRRLADRSCRARIIVMSGMDAKVLAAAQRFGKTHDLQIHGILQKPINIDILQDLLRKAWIEARDITEEALAAAIDGGELTLHYQPKVSLLCDGSSPMYAVEALVRWNHPSHGFVQPNDFIPLAEKTGLIAPLTDFVLQSAIDQLKAWRNDGHSFSVAINLPPQILTDLQFPDRVAGLLDPAGVPCDALMLEITESAAMGDDPETIDILTRFRLKNIGLSLDDFGTGYSSLVQLYRMPFNELKIDRSFVSDIDDSEEARVIVRSIVDLAKNLDLGVCAEGVVTEAALDYLRSIGCDRAQGNFISKPLPPDELIQFGLQWQPEAAKSASQGGR